MFFLTTPSWLNSDETLLTAWTGSTFFTGIHFIDQIIGTSNPITFFGWVLTTVIAIVAAYSKWKLNRAEEQERLSEARKNNAEAKKIEHELSEEYMRLIADQCEVDECLYRAFYQKIIENNHSLDANE